MKLTDKNGYSVTFEVSGYEYPWPDEDCDSNWLMITTFVTHPAGTWKTIDPSLLTNELDNLRGFFNKIIENPNKSRDLSFLEPNLCFQYSALESEQILSVFFYLEARTFWFEKDDKATIENLYLEIPFSPNEFKSASESINQYCIKFPKRPLSWVGIEAKNLITVILD